MDEKALNWIADVVNEAIAKATAPLTERIETMTAQLQQLQNSQTPGYDDTEIKQAVQALRESTPAPYDDGEIRQQFKQLAEAVGESEKLADRIEEVAKSVPAAYDDALLRRQIEDVAKSVPAAYDDTALRGEMDVLLKGVDVQLDCIRKSLPQDGKPGQDGRDALQLEVLPAIDEQKSYTRGTYAKHAGGLWRSFEQTSGLRGWECIVDGIAVVIPEMVGKTLKLKVLHSSGMETDLSAHIPVQTYKGVFAHGEHEQGDTVTWAGSLWHCNVTGTKALPGDGSADWTLAVKKGRDGREVVKTERAQGPVHLTPLQFIDQLGR